ncbi:MAG: DUF6706 family protein [Prevotella sp.]
MTVKDYITQKCSTFGIQVSDADILDMKIVSGLEDDTSVDGDNMNLINMGFIEFIPQLLLRATSISESGFSMSWNIEGIKSFYSMLCDKYDVEDKLTDRPRINFL